MKRSEFFPVPPAATLANLWITLARAFLPPLEPDHWRAMYADLALDLADWRSQLGLDRAPRAEELLTAQAAYGEHEALLQHYSALFLNLRERVSLSIGRHLAGGNMVADTLERWQIAYGLDHSSSYHDRSDDLPALLEFLSVIVGLEESALAAEFAQIFLLPALPGMLQAMHREGADHSPYQWLLRFTLAALQQIYPPAEPTLPVAPETSLRPNLGCA
jgi:TorA maturation chaperone TorD